MKFTLNLTKIMAIGAITAVFVFIAILTVQSQELVLDNTLAGNGPHLIIDSTNRVVGVVTEGRIVAVNPNLAKQDPRTGVSTIRLQTQRVRTEQKNWNPEPSSCPRGIKVLRYGTWGC